MLRCLKNKSVYFTVKFGFPVQESMRSKKKDLKVCNSDKHHLRTIEKCRPRSDASFWGILLRIRRRDEVRIC